MGMFGKIGAALGQIGKYYTSPEGAQSGLAILQDYGTGGSDNYRALQMQRQKLAQEQQQQQAMAALMARVRGPDTQTPQVNQLISEANRMNGQRGGAPMETMTPQRAGLPMDQETMSLLAKYGAAGGNMQLPLGMSQMMQPEAPRYIEGPNGIYAAGPDGVSMAHAYPEDPLKQAALQALIDQRSASASYSRAKAAQPYAPQRVRAGAGVGAGASNNPWDKYKR